MWCRYHNHKMPYVHDMDKKKKEETEMRSDEMIILFLAYFISLSSYLISLFLSILKRSFLLKLLENSH